MPLIYIIYSWWFTVHCKNGFDAGYLACYHISVDGIHLEHIICCYDVQTAGKRDLLLGSDSLHEIWIYLKSFKS